MENIKDKKLDKLKKFLKNNFEESIQAFTTRNIVGDYILLQYMMKTKYK